MFYIGIDIVSTANTIKEKLNLLGINKENSKSVAIGYGRISVPYADKTITEITCNGKGAAYLLCTAGAIGAAIMASKL